MKFVDIYGDQHKTFWGALKVDMKYAYAKKVRDAAVKEMIQNRVEGYESDPEIYEEDPTIYMAYTQEKLEELLNQGIKTIHLSRGQFIIPGDIGGVTYIGIGSPTVRFDGKQVKADIDVQGVTFTGEDYLADVEVFYRIFQKSSGLAVRLLNETAKKENASAQTLLGICYRDGFGIEVHRAAGVEWIQKAAEQGYAPAQMMYGFHLMDDSRGLEKFYSDIFVEGIRWIQKAAKQGYARAQVLLGACYLNGFGGLLLIEDDENNGDHAEEIVSELMKAVQWIQKAAEQEDKDAQTILGICLMEDGNALWNMFGPNSIRIEARDEWVKMLGIERSDARAIDWFRRAAEQGHSEGQALLGCCFLEGLVGVKNPAEGMKWLRKAASQGCSEAQELLKSCNPKFAMDAETVACWRNRIADSFLERFLKDESMKWQC